MSVDTTTTSRPYAPNRVRKLANDTMFMRTFSTTSRFAQSRVIASELMRSKIVSSTCRHQRQPRHTSWWLSAAALAHYNRMSGAKKETCTQVRRLKGGRATGTVIRRAAAAAAWCVVE